jgi:hypothetical protein
MRLWVCLNVSLHVILVLCGNVSASSVREESEPHNIFHVKDFMNRSRRETTYDMTCNEGLIILRYITSKNSKI